MINWYNKLKNMKREYEKIFGFILVFVGLLSMVVSQNYTDEQVSICVFLQWAIGCPSFILGNHLIDLSILKSY